MRSNRDLYRADKCVQIETYKGKDKCVQIETTEKIKPFK